MKLDELLWFAVGACVALALFYHPPVRAAPLIPEQARSIYYVAYGEFKGPREWLEQMPRIHLATQAQLCDMTKQGPDCRVLGAYFPGDVHILNTLDFSQILPTSILLHEFIHHFQWLKTEYKELNAAIDRGDMHEWCRLWLENERQAYRMQMNVLAKAGDYGSLATVRHTVRQITCD